MPQLKGEGLTGDLNQYSHGKNLSIYIEILRQNEDPPPVLVNENSLPVLTTYDFAPYPDPDYTTVRVCLLPGLLCVSQNLGPCFHVQQTSSFADQDNLYIVSSFSAATHGQFYLLTTPLLEPSDSGQPSVETKGTVKYYEEMSEFNHPGDLAVFGRIVMTAAQNYDPVPAGSLTAVGCKLIHCDCITDVPTRRESLAIWDFTNSLSAPEKHIFDKAAFTPILTIPMDDSASDSLFGGSVNGKLVIEFESKWLTVTDTSNLGDIENSWKEITSINFVGCPEETAQAGRQFMELNGMSYYITFRNDECYTLRPVTFDGTHLTVSGCDALLTTCLSANSQLADVGGDKEIQAF